VRTNLTGEDRTYNANRRRISTEVGLTFARWGAVTNLTISGAECVEALCAAGFRVRKRAAGQTVLERGARRLVVPDRLVLPPEILDELLAGADLSVERFVWLLGEVTTQTEIPIAESGAQ
jgi:hypothetical protein